jgi:hypothetical protein
MVEPVRRRFEDKQLPTWGYVCAIILSKPEQEGMAESYGPLGTTKRANRADGPPDDGAHQVAASDKVVGLAADLESADEWRDVAAKSLWNSPMA